MIQKTLVLIKPDGVKRNLIGRIIDRFENTGLKVINLKMLNVSKEVLEKHYPTNDEFARSIGEKSLKAEESIADPIEQGKKVIGWLHQYVTSGPIVAMILQGDDAVSKVRQITGSTDPSKADEGTIRRDLGIDSISKANKELRSVYNLIHASGTEEEAEKEIELWFGHE